MNKRKCIIGQSGGPTVAINATLAGVIQGAFTHGFSEVYGMVNGIEGLLHSQIIDLKEISKKEQLDALKVTPAMYLGSCRYKIPKDNQEIKHRIINILEEHGITDMFYIGGNDSMDTIKKLSEYAQSIDSPIHFIGIPKTIDNDLMMTHYTPGYPSACQYVATSLLEIAFDTAIYPIKSVTIVEIMGRDAGWLCASSALVNEAYPDSIDFIYMPEVVFDQDDFVKRIKSKLEYKNNIVIAVSEGIKDRYGMYLSLDSGMSVDAFGHRANNGCGDYLKTVVRDNIGCKVRSIQLNILQRCSAHLSNQNDLDMAVGLGAYATKCAYDGLTAKMVCIQEDLSYSYCHINDAANHVKEFPTEWIDEDHHSITDDYLNYMHTLFNHNQESILPTYMKR